MNRTEERITMRHATVRYFTVLLLMTREKTLAGTVLFRDSPKLAQLNKMKSKRSAPEIPSQLRRRS